MKVSPMRRKIFLCLTAFLITYSATSFAATENTEAAAEESIQDSTPAILSPKIEGAGLYNEPADGSLGVDLWRNTPRSTITKLLAAMPVSSREPTMQKLIFGVLLSKTDITMINNDVPAERGRDLLTLRLEKLIAAGAYRQALDLYSSLELENPPKSVARAGILAMLFSGEKSLACLELNTVPQYGIDDFFKTIAAYCDATLSEKPSENSLEVLRASPDKLLLSLATEQNFTVTYSPDSFEKYSTLEKAMLAAEARLVLPTNPDRDFRDVPPTHIQIVMKNSGLSEKDKFVLNTRALDWGLIRASDYKKNCIAVIKLDDRKDPALAVPESAEDWQKLPYFLQIALNKKTDPEKWPFIRDAFPIGQKYGLSTLVPFAELIYKTRPETVSFNEIEIAVLVMNRAGYQVPAQWIEIIDNYTPSPAEKQAYTRLLAAAYLSEKEDKMAIKLKALLEGRTDPESFLVNNIIENVDNGPQPKHTASEIYENNSDLTFTGDYVMPSIGVWNRLLEAGKEGYIGETILLSTVALREKPLRGEHPGLLRNVLRSLKSVGLTDISGNMAIAAVLGNTDDF